MKLKIKIQLFSSLFMLLLIILINTSIYFLFYKISADNELEQLSVQTNSIQEAIHKNPDIPKSELLHAFVPSNGLIRVIDEQGKNLIPVLTKRPEYRDLPSTFSDYEKKEIIKDESGSFIALVAKPVIWDDGKVVTLQVINYLTTLEETMQTLLYVLIAASILMLVPSIIGGNVLSKFILRPIKELIDTMKDNTREEKWKTINLENKSKDELFEMEKTFNEMIVHLKENFHKQEEFVSDASHELKTPISIIKSYAELLKRRGKSHPEVFDESVIAIDTEADRMQQLVTQMLDLAKNKQFSTFENVNVAALAKEITHTFQTAYERNIEFIAQSEQIMVTGDAEQLKQVMYILLNNAIKYSDKEIKVIVKTRGNNALIEVIDQGPGISSADQKRIFDRFYRVDRARTRSSGGTGLGLSIAKTIADAHNGTLTVTSVEGKGSTFMLQLPIMKEV